MLKLFAGIGDATINDDTITFKGYPFEPSFVYERKSVNASDIRSIDLSGLPPTIQVDNELIFISAVKKEELGKFAERHCIKIVSRPDIWSWILEPFLDTEFTKTDDARLNQLFEKYGLPLETVQAIRKEVEGQMIKFNAVHWDWTNLGAADVLTAMRAEYNKEEFKVFYAEVMRIALITDK